MSSRTATVGAIARVRPAGNISTVRGIEVDQLNKTVTAHVDETQTSSSSAAADSWTFALNGVLDNSTQQETFESAARDLCDSFLGGYNGTLMAYGQTGAGKTFTMTGDARSDFSRRGIIPRAIEYIFRELGFSTINGPRNGGVASSSASPRSKPNDLTTLRVSYIEIYNEQAYDLLALEISPTATNGPPGTEVPQPTKLTISQGSKGEIYARGVRTPVVRTEEEALEWFFEGETSRAIAEHALNKASTRSHCVFSIYLEQEQDLTEDSTSNTQIGIQDEGLERPKAQIIKSKLHFVDLAGSERVSKTHSAGTTLTEAKYINKSLSFLEQVVLALVSKRSHIPYRSSKLTHFLQDSLGGNCKTRLIACVWGDELHVPESVATLRFATRMMRVKVTPSKNVLDSSDQVPNSALVAKYERRIHQLERELAMYDVMAGRTGISYKPPDDAERRLFRDMVDEYLHDEKDVSNMSNPSSHSPNSLDRLMQVSTMRQVQTVFEEFRRLYHESLQDIATHTQRVPQDDKSSRQSNRIVESPSAFDDTNVNIPRPGTTPTHNEVGKSGLFDDWKANNSSGQQLFQDYETAKENRAHKTTQAKQVAMAVNQIKAEIDKCMDDLKTLQNNSEGTTGGDQRLSISKEEHELTAQLKQHKKKYRGQYEQLQQLKSEVKYLVGSVNSIRTKMMLEFETWTKTRAGDDSRF